MARTFVRVELEHSDAERSFSTAMGQLGFVRTVKGRKTLKMLNLPSGMYVIERTSPIEALELTRQAARASKTRVRVLCAPVGGDIRFCNLRAV
jgi:hypothetical protein